MNDVLVNELAPPVTVAIGGKTLSLIYDLQAVILYKQKTGDSLFHEGMFAKLDPQEDPERFALCLWAGLQRKHPEVTMEWLGENIPFGPQVSELLASVTRAVTAHFPKKAASPNAAAPAEPPAQEVPVVIEAPDEESRYPKKTSFPKYAAQPVSISD